VHQYAKAEPLFRDALAMYQQLYTKAQYPQGHPELARSINNIAGLVLGGCPCPHNSATAEPLRGDKSQLVP
jgi:hypothetical protein